MSCPNRHFAASHSRLSTCQHVLWIVEKSIRGDQTIPPFGLFCRYAQPLRRRSLAPANGEFWR